MADIELVIKIPEKEYNILKNLKIPMTWAEHLIAKGTPLNDVLDKIRAEIEQEYNRLNATREDETLELGECLGLRISLKIIDKYKEKVAKLSSGLAYADQDTLMSAT